MFEKYLEEIGLSDKEASVYVALLQVDHDSVLDLSKRTGINRTTIYPVLETLAKKGLVSEMQIDKKVHYKAEPPERLESFVERRKLNFEEQSKRLKDIVPQLKSIQRESGERPVVKCADHFHDKSSDAQRWRPEEKVNLNPRRHKCDGFLFIC